MEVIHQDRYAGLVCDLSEPKNLSMSDSSEYLFDSCSINCISGPREIASLKLLEIFTMSSYTHLQVFNK